MEAKHYTREGRFHASENSELKNRACAKADVASRSCSEVEMHKLFVTGQQILQEETSIGIQGKQNRTE